MSSGIYLECKFRMFSIIFGYNIPVLGTGSLSK